MDPWVVCNVLQPNLEWTGFLDVSSIHTVRFEDFIDRAKQFIGLWFSLSLFFNNLMRLTEVLDLLIEAICFGYLIFT